MSTIKSSDEHLTLNADGSSKDIKFQANGVEKASISSAGAFTSTTIDATKLTGNLPAINGASLTNLPAASQLDHSGTKKFEATASGVTLTGTAGTSPILELNNADTEDNDTGRETSIRFTGNRSGGEDVINAQISGHHQGNSDNDDGMILFYTNNGAGLEEAMRIDNDGRLLIGTTDSGNINDNGLHVNADSYGFFAAKIAHRVANGDGYGLMINIPGYTGSGGQWMARFYTSGGSMGGIKSNQNSTSYLTSSDYRLKENVDYTWDATTRLKQLKPARFNWINDSTNTLEDGFLAHEVSNIVPNAVSGTKDDTETLANVVLRANGVVDSENVNQEQWIAGKESGLYSSDTTWKASHTQDVNQTLDASKLVPLLVKTIQELEARITALEA